MSAIEETTLHLIKMDFTLIADAIRRLKEGTCCLDNQDETASAHHLLNQTSTALETHISIEERVFESFSKNPQAADLPEKFFEAMKAEHRQLRRVLAEIKCELETSHPAAFKATLDIFSTALNRHTQLELSAPFLEVLEHVNPSTLTDIRARVSHGYVD